MNALFEQIKNIFGAMPLSRKLLMGGMLVAVFFGFVALYLYGQKTSFQPLYGSLSTDDAASITDALTSKGVEFQLTSGGTMILVPAEQVYDLRLSLASEGLPQGGGVGFEIFDETDFGTTEFVQKLNYQRALQGELARTIKEFNEVSDARVMIVMAEDSVFIEESKPASASVLLKLRSNLSKSKVEAVVNLVSSAVEDLSNDNVTVVDTQGNVLSKKSSESAADAELADAKLEYKLTYENNLAAQIQSMLEQIVGSGNAIVRVAADMNFDQVDLSEEIYDPEAQVIRSRQSTSENASTAEAADNGISSVNPVVADGAVDGVNNKRTEESQKENETVNYEISRTVRRTVNPVAEIERISVAAVLDGNYTIETAADGSQTRTYEPRTQEELDRFKDIVQSAMGYSSDREDQISVESFPFSYMDEMAFGEGVGTDWTGLMRRYGHLAGYAVLILAAFLFLVKPVVRTVQDVAVQSQQAALTVKHQSQEALPEGMAQGALPPPQEMTGRQKATFLARQDVDKTTEQIRGWLGEAS
jgi:flagellar M-ring protein FliF